MRLKKNLQKFSHYVVLTVMYSMCVGTAGLIVFSMIVAFNNL